MIAQRSDIAVTLRGTTTALRAGTMTPRAVTSSLLLAFGATAAGCSATIGDPPGVGGDGTGSDGTGSGAVPHSAQGKYALHSTFDISANMPGTAGDVVRAFIAATDDPADPTLWIVQQVIGALPNGAFKNVLNGATPFVAGYLNDRLLDVAPSFVTDILDFGDKFGQIAKGFGTLEELDVAADGTATHIVNGVHFKVDDQELDFAFKDYNLSDVKVAGVQVALDNTGKLTISSHKVDLSYGAMLRLGVDNVIIPMVDPSATTLGDVLHDWVDCANVGEYIYEAVNIGSPSTFEQACDTGLTLGGNFIYSEIAKIDGAAFEFGIDGTAKAVDTNHDGTLDTIQTGKWAGTLSYAGTPAPLATATFIGSRM